MGLETKAAYAEAMASNSTAEDGLSIETVTLYTTKASGSLTLKTKGPANTGYFVDWGDSSQQWVQHTGTGNEISTAHAYGATVGYKTIVLTGIITDITSFDFQNDTTILGSTSEIAKMTGLTFINQYNTRMYNGVDNLAALTNLVSLFYHSCTTLGGNIDAITPLTSLVSIYLDNTGISYTTTTLPAWSSATIRVQNNAWTVAEVNNFLCDLDTAGGSNGTLDISGTNAAPTVGPPDGLAAKTSLQGKGWTVTTN